MKSCRLSIVFSCWYFISFSQIQTEIPLSSLEHLIVGTDSLERALSTVAISNNELAVIGFTNGTGSGDALYSVISHRDLEIRKQKHFGGDGFDIGISLTTTSDNSLIFAGFTWKSNLDAWIVKLTNEGDTIWSRAIDAGGSERANHILELKDGSLLVTGQTTSPQMNTDVLLAKFSDAGTMMWQRSFQGDKVDRGFATVEFEDGNYLMHGLTNENYPGNSDILLMKVDQEGNQVWRKEIGGMKGEISHAIMPKGKTSLLLIGYTSENSFPKSDPLIIEIDHAGQVVEKYTFAFANDARLMDGVLSDDRTKLLLAGYFNGENNQTSPLLGTFDFTTRKFSLLKISQTSFSGDLYKIVQVGKKAYLAVGQATKIPGLNSDLFIIKWKVS